MSQVTMQPSGEKLWIGSIEGIVTDIASNGIAILWQGGSTSVVVSGEPDAIARMGFKAGSKVYWNQTIEVARDEPTAEPEVAAKSWRELPSQL